MGTSVHPLAIPFIGNRKILQLLDLQGKTPVPTVTLKLEDRYKMGSTPHPTKTLTTWTITMERSLKNLYVAIAIMAILILLNVILTVNGLSPFAAL